jgi:uncharacterized membrane protein
MFDTTLFHPHVVPFTNALFLIYVLFEIMDVLTDGQSFRPSSVHPCYIRK